MAPGVKPMKILIAEDDRTSRMILEGLFRKWDYSIVLAEDGTSAWALLENDPTIDLAVLDWQMPGLDGPEICRRARKLDRATRPHLILLTAMGRKEDLAEGFEAGADDYLTKPFDPGELQARVRVGARIVQLHRSLMEKIDRLEEAMEEIKTLQGIIPICMHCHKIRSDEEAWQRVEHYIESRSNAKFSHSICPDCMQKYYHIDPKRDGATVS
jgi:DNA-binding response OmpR family regulator